jgi:hypothetical protein
MSSIPITHRDQLITSLQSIESRTAEIFMVLAESLPALVGEMKSSLQRSQSALSCMTASSRDGCDSNREISEVVATLREEMERGNNSLLDMAERDSELFSRLQHGISQLESISQSIDRIRMDSEDMELVSLNAMTVALKAGSAGRAFSYITEELKRLANRTITLSEEISFQGGELISSFQALEQQLNDARSYHEELVNGLGKRISAGLNELEEAVHGTISGLHQLRDESAEVREPVNGMMEAIQLQDIIRQSIDHIILALKAIRPESELTTDEALLDELSFMRQIPDLASRLIDDVAGQIDNSVATFMTLTEQAEGRVRHLEEAEQALLVRETEGDTSGEASGLDARFSRAVSMLQQLMDDLQRNVEKKTTLVSRSGSLTKDVEVLEQQFEIFTTLVRRFHSIDVAARIEVAKQDVLRQMGTSTEQMTALTRTIESHVQESLESTQEFIKSTSNAIESHRLHFDAEVRFVRDFGRSIRQQYEALDNSRKDLTRTVGDFSLFTDKFLDVFGTSKENGRRLSDLSVQIKELKGELNNMEEVINDRYQRELQNQGLDSWSIENDRLKEIIERFTIFTHKQQAGELIGLDVEDGVGAGDVTLF